MKKIIIIVIIVIILAAFGIGVFIFFQNKQASIPLVTSGNAGDLLSTSSGTPVTQGTSTQGIANASSGVFLSLGDAGITSADITPGAPSDAPQGQNIPFQTASGTVILKNFYTSAQGYWAPLDVLLLADSASYTIWYYRDESFFEIDIPLDGGLSDESNAASQLSGLLGVSEQELCALPVTVVFPIDGGLDSETASLSFCSTPAF